METKPLEEIEALRLEKIELQMRLLQEQLQRLAIESQIMIAQAAERAGVMGWRLNLAERLWINPTEEKREDLNANHNK